VERAFLTQFKSSKYYK
jgi:protein phosphatase 1G